MSLDKYLDDKFKHYTVNVRLSEEDHKKVTELAKKHDTSVIKVIRALIKKEIAETKE